MSLTNCIQKAGDAISRADKTAILSLAKELRAQGVPNEQAGRQAVERILAETHATLAKMHKDLGIAEPDFARKEKPEPREMPADHEVAMAPRLDAALRRWGKGEANERDLAAAIQRDQQIARERRELTAERDRARGPKWVQQRLLEAERHGEIPEETGEFARWLLQHAPHLAEDLALTVRERGGGARGVYNPAERLVTLFRSADVQTGVHEILHHTERMMPPEVQDGIRREWQEAVKARAQEVRQSVLRRPTDLGPEAARNQAYLRALDAMDAAAAAGHGEMARALYQGQPNSGLPPLRHLFPYELSSPSEFWAVNGARLMGDRYDARHTWVERARQWLGDLMQFVRSRVGLKSNAALLRGLESVIGGDGSRVRGAGMLENTRRPLPDEPSFSRKDEGEKFTPDDLFKWSREVEQRHGLSRFDTYMDSNGDIVLGVMTAKHGERGEGRGTAAMLELTALADREGKRIRLNPATKDDLPGEGTTSRARLVQFYKRFGFVENRGRNKDFTTMDAMYRDPKAAPDFARKEEEPAKPATPNPSHGFHTREIQVDGQWRPIEDSTGRLLARGDFRAQQNFYGWFGDSKVVDARGRPLTLYHGTDKDFARFDPKKIGDNFAADERGFFFTNDPKMASDYAENDTIGVNKRMGGNVMPAYVALKKPLIVDDAFLRSEGMAPIGKDEDVVSFWDNYQAQIHEWVNARKSDGVILVDNSYRQKDGEPTRLVVAFKPAQIKSAIGNVGTFDPKNPDIRFARKGTTTATANLPASAPLGTWERSKSVVSDLIDEGLTRSGVYKFTSPMSEGSVRAKAIAQNFANAERQAKAEWTRIQDVIAKDFPDKTVREKMWNAADQENEILSGRLTPSANVGLASLTPRQRDVVEQLHAYGEELLQRAKDVGMFSGDGVPYWTPRMMVMLDANGDYVKPTEPGKKQTSGGDGKNVFTSSSNLKQRKYLTAADTEAAMQAKGGELVRDITTMPMAMARLERAVAGRELINQIKDLGKAAGLATVSSSMHEGFFTLDHPAFTTYQPRFEQDPATGKSVVQKDAHGDPILDRVPLYMSKEFEGPIKAILSNTDGTAYRAYMLLKSKAMSAIMFSPLIHQMVIFGRALGYDPTMVGTVGLYFRGNAAKKDEALVRTAIDAGLVPMGGSHAGMIDVTDIARGIGREGGLGDPNESWIAHGAKAIIGAVNKDAGAAAKRFVDKAGDVWHGTLLWDRVGDLQMGIFSHAYDRLQAEGFDPKVAAVMAAHWGNRYAGAVGRENMGEYARKAANVLLFSRSFNAGNLGTIKDMLYGLPAGLRAKIEYEHGKAAASQAFTEARRKAVGGFIADAALSLIALSLAQSAVDKLKKDKGWDEIFGGYMDRAQRMVEEVKRHPMTPKSYSPWQLSPTHDNEPGKQDRVDMGEIPGAGGRHEYMRLPTGKVVEDLINWTTHPAETFSSKMSPLAKAAWQIVSNDKGFGVPVYDPDGSMAGFGVDVAKHLAKAQTPWDTIVTAWDKFQGKTTPIESAKLLGNMTGFSASQGHPQGPEAGVAAQVEDRVKAQKLMAMEEVKRLLKYDKEDQAREKLEAVGLTPREVSQVIKKIENPKEMTPAQRRRFNQHGNEEDQQRMERVTR